MADQRVEDLPEVAALAADDKFYILDASDTTTDSDADGTSSFIQASTLGGLEITTASPTTGNIDAAVGKMYITDISGLTANRRFNLPTTANMDVYEQATLPRHTILQCQEIL